LTHKTTGHILKPAQRELRGQREIDFFESIFDMRTKGAELRESDNRVDNNNETRDATSRWNIMRQLARFVPTFYGARTVHVFGTAHTFLEMEDITARFRQPCILDVKIGAVTWDPEASVDKVQYETMKYPLGQQLGFRLLGIRVSKQDGQEVHVYKYADVRHAHRRTSVSRHEAVEQVVARTRNCH
jgi:1D-myo-inositol-tetrakisphosphate 5-kinase/inositol-polyphosphate multikinase